ncbi:exonuclease SbcC [Streptomyces sp. NPDC006552]|uniref:exonuclease SbcC n=1 Tax=Streptomyces sp. NPDC006552 TaxID=3157179 RepID=UPI0033A0D0D2
MANDANGIELSMAELREIAGFAARCARRVLPLCDEGPLTGSSAVPGGGGAPDTRPREAVAAAEVFAGGGRRTAALRQSAWAAYKAAQAADEAGAPVAADAARAASHAAAAAFLHPKASAHQVKHVLGAAAHAACAQELAEPGSGAGIVEWARGHAPAAVTAVLRRLPAAPSGGGRAGEFTRELDAALRR